MDKLQIDVNKFFEDVRNCLLTEIETFNIVELLTDNFKREKLKILVKDLELFISIEKEEKLAEFSREDYDNAYAIFEKQNREIPIIKVPDFGKDEYLQILKNYQSRERRFGKVIEK